VWFAPKDPVATPLPRGSTDYFDLFTPDAPWNTAASHVNVFKMYLNALSFSDSQLQAIIDNLGQRGIAIALELGPLTPQTCGGGIEGFMHDGAIALMHRIVTLGGHVRYVAMDEPFYYGSIYSTPIPPTDPDPKHAACNYSMEQVAEQIEAFISEVNAIDPDTRVGDIEPFFPAVGSDLGEPQYEVWLGRMASSLAFFHFDVDWYYSGWTDPVERMEHFTQGIGLRSGIIYNGDGGGGLLDEGLSDATWIANAEANMVFYELSGGEPDQVVFQSWVAPPRHVLPETDPSAFTYLIDRYFRARTALRLDSTSDRGDGSLSVAGRLLEIGGAPVAGASVVVSATPTDGPGAPDTLTISGMVPTGATQAVLGLRVNVECGCNQDSALAWFAAAYQEDAGPDLVPNGDLSAGASGWRLGGTAPPIVQPSELGAGNELAVAATAGQTTLVNTPVFTVTAGALYEARFAARIPPAAQGSGYFTVVFLDAANHEITRTKVPLRPITLSSTSATGADGSYSTSVARPPGTPAITASFAGTDTDWPARAATE
jgi:hypothetical protein